MTARDSAERLLVLVPWLLERPGASLAEAADVVGSSADVVRQELEWLCYCGGPGLGGGTNFEVDFIEDRVTVEMAPGLAEPLAPTPVEAVRLLLALSSIEEVAGDRLPKLRSALAKIRAATGLDEGVVAGTVEGESHLGDLQAAISEGRRLHLDYRGRTDDEVVRRDVDPWHLEYTSDGWYLHAHDHDRDAHRVFRIDRIAEVAATGQSTSTDAPDELPSPRWAPDGEVFTVSLRLHDGARWLGDQVTATSDSDVDGVRHVTFDTDSMDWCANLAAAGGPDVEVVEPDELRAVLAERARAALAANETVESAVAGPGTGT